MRLRPCSVLALCLALLATPVLAAPVSDCERFDPALGMARFAAWQDAPDQVMAVVNRARAAGQVCAASANDLELTRIEAALRAGLYAHASAALGAVPNTDPATATQVALLMADLAYAHGRPDVSVRWLDRAGAPDVSGRKNASPRVQFLRAEALRAGSNPAAALDAARELPAQLRGYVAFNVAARAWQGGQLTLADTALTQLLGLPAYDAAALDLRQRGRLLHARVLLADGRAADAAAQLDAIPQASGYARAALSLRAHAALAQGDGDVALQLAAVDGAQGIDALLLPYVLEQRGQPAPAHAAYRRVLEQLEAEVGVLGRARQQSAAGFVRAFVTVAPNPGAGTGTGTELLGADLVAAFLAEPEVAQLLLQIQALDRRARRVAHARRDTYTLGQVAAERNRRSVLTGRRVTNAAVEMRAGRLQAQLSVLAGHLDDAWYVAASEQRQVRDQLLRLHATVTAAGRPDLLQRIERLQGRQLWELEWHRAARRQVLASHHADLQIRTRLLEQRSRALRSGAEVAATGGHDQIRFEQLRQRLGELDAALQDGQADAVAALTSRYESWLDEQLDDHRRARSYARLALARTADALLLAGSQ